MWPSRGRGRRTTWSLTFSDIECLRAVLTRSLTLIGGRGRGRGAVTSVRSLAAARPPAAPLISPLGSWTSPTTRFETDVLARSERGAGGGRPLGPVVRPVHAPSGPMLERAVGEPPAARLSWPRSTSMTTPAHRPVVRGAVHPGRLRHRRRQGGRPASSAPCPSRQVVAFVARAADPGAERSADTLVTAAGDAEPHCARPSSSRPANEKAAFALEALLPGSADRPGRGPRRRPGPVGAGCPRPTESRRTLAAAGPCWRRESASTSRPRRRRRRGRRPA